MIHARLAAFALLLSQATCGAAAAADNGPWLPKAQGSRVGVDFDWWPTDVSHSLTWSIAGQIQLARAAYVDVDVPWALSTKRPTAVFGNPSIGAHWADAANDRLAGFAGGTLGVSTLTYEYPLPEDLKRKLDLRLNARRNAVSNRVYADLHRFVPNYFFMRAWGGIELRILPVLFYRVELTPILAIPVIAGKHADIALEIHNALEARASVGVGGGMHLQAVFLAGDLVKYGLFDPAAVQTAMEPYLVYEPIRGLYARAGVLVALDELGFPLDKKQLVAIRVALGGKWGGLPK